MGWLLDTLQNLMSGLNTAKDKSTHSKFMFDPVMADEAENAYTYDWLTKKIVNIPPEDMTRQWRNWQASPQQIEAIEAEEKRLRIQRKVKRAIQLARLDGGAALYLGTNDRNPREPLKADRITLGGLTYVHLIRRLDLKPMELERDPLSPNYGEPVMYQLSSSTGAGMVEIHPTRVVRFIGVPPIDVIRDQNDGWGESVIQALNRALKNAALSSESVAAALHELKIDFISVPNLSKELSTKDGAQRVTDRFAHANMMKSMFNMVLLGDNEQFGRKEINFSALPQTVQLFLQIAAGAADIPVTRLLGQSPSGMNSTGESDIRNYYDMLKSQQATELSPTLESLDELLIRSALGSRPKAVHYLWAPLWQLTDTEKATNAKTKAETSQIYSAMGIFVPEALQQIVYNQLVEDSVYPGLEAAIDEFGTEVEPPEGPEEEDPLAAEQEQANDRLFDATPRSLYVSRKVENPQAIIDWAKSQGFTTTLPAEDLHVTIAYSREPVDWIKAGRDLWDNEKGTFTVASGGPRIVEKFGNAIVLVFASDRLYWRHMDIRRIGASWDYPDFNPHVTITYEAPADLDLTKIKPYDGPIELGVEKFAEIDDSWSERLNEV